MCRILTDQRIPQSQLWCEKTELLQKRGQRILDVVQKIPAVVRQKILPVVQLIIIIKYMHFYDVVITAGIRTGQLFALFRSLLLFRKPRHIILELMLDEESSSKGWRFKRSLQRLLFSSVDAIFVSSKEEIRNYSKRLQLDEKRFKFIHFHTNIIQPTVCFCPNSFILSAGRTGRDFHTLVEAARYLPDDEFIIVSDRQSAQGLELPKNVRLHVEIPREDYLRLVKECSFVVIPLQTLVKSTGQVVILEAMAYGKPVIATDAVGTRDYIRSGFNGILVPPKDPMLLAEAIRRLRGDLSMQETLTQNAMDFINKNCTFDAYVGKILDTADALCRPDAIGHGEARRQMRF